MKKAKAFLRRWKKVLQKKAQVLQVGAFSLVLVPLTTTFDVDLAGMMTTAEDLFNSLFPAFVVVIGITLAIGLIGMIIGAITKAVRSGAR